jgi:2-polyprenyl-3-methyl-5-hydroxy-6-metoxy-1,4-benzoquinol methylase
MLGAPMAELSVPYARIAAALPEHLAAFLGVSIEEVARRTATARAERNRRWIEADPRTEAEREALYSELGELDLLKYAEWHRTDLEKQELHDALVAVARDEGRTVLDVGGGIGDTTLAFAANGVAVTYVDFPGVCSDFARFRWGQFDCLARVTPMTPAAFWNAAGARFGAVASIDVLEHLENPVRHAARYRDLLEPGGHLFVTACFEHSERNPDHLPENDAYRRLFGGERKTRRRSVLANLGFRRRRWYWFEKR